MTGFQGMSSALSGISGAAMVGGGGGGGGGGGADAAGMGLSALGMAVPYVGMAMGIFNMFAGASAAETEAEAANATRKAEWEEAEFQRKWEHQIQARAQARKNAQRWFNNRKLAEAANKTRAERDFYIRYNYQNEVGEFSRNSQQVNDMLVGRFQGQGWDADSGTAKALLRSSLETQKRQLVAGRIKNENQLRDSERTQIAQLGKRDFGYNQAIPYMPGSYMETSPDVAFNTALIAGIGGAIGGVTGGVQQIQQQSTLDQIAKGMSA
jgi:hypothetical protein